MLPLDQLAQLLRGFEVSVLVDEGMAPYGIGVWTLHWVFAEDEGHEAPEFGRSLIHLEIFSDDLGELFLVLDVERVLASEKFMS